VRDQVVLLHVFPKKTKQLKKTHRVIRKTHGRLDAAFSGSRWNMKKEKVKTFRSRLREDLRDPEFKALYQEERQALKLAMKITKLREKKGLSQQQMAKLMGTSQQAISRIESGEYEGFTLRTLEKIAEATGTRVKIEFVAA
jgi:DNA-binding XRE family transcriptional regulator